MIDEAESSVEAAPEPTNTAETTPEPKNDTAITADPKNATETTPDKTVASPEPKTEEFPKNNVTDDPEPEISAAEDAKPELAPDDDTQLQTEAAGKEEAPSDTKAEAPSADKEETPAAEKEEVPAAEKEAAEDIVKEKDKKTSKASKYKQSKDTPAGEKKDKKDKKTKKGKKDKKNKGKDEATDIDKEDVEGQEDEKIKKPIEDTENKKEGKKGKKGKKTVSVAAVEVEIKEGEGETTTEEDGKTEKKKKKSKIKRKASATIRSQLVVTVPSAYGLNENVASRGSIVKIRKSRSTIKKTKSYNIDMPLQSLMYLREKFRESFESSTSIISEVSFKKKKSREKEKSTPSESDEVLIGDLTTEESLSTDADSKKKKKKTERKRKKIKKKEEMVEEDIEEEKPRLVPPFVPIIPEPEPEEDVEKKEKVKIKQKKKGPKLSDKERRRLEQQRAEEARIQAEFEAQRAAEEERIRLDQERKAAIEKEKREIAEQALRVDQLQNCINAVRAILEYNKQEDLKEKEDMEWERYLKCDGLPDVSNCAEMNTYLHLWEQELPTMTMDKAAIKTNEVIALLDELSDFIHHPVGVTDAKVKDWKWIRSLFRDMQNASMDAAIYKLLRDINKNLNRIDIPTADYRRRENNFGFCLWVLVQLPTCMFNPRAPAKPRIEVNFAELKANVLYPSSIDCKAMAISAIYLKYDHLSDTCAQYEGHSCPEDFKKDLNEYTFLEWDKKLRYKYERRIKKVPEINPESEEPPPPPEPEVNSFPVGTVPVVRYQKLEPTASQYVISIEDELSDQIRLLMLNQVPPNIINLRKYLILGGIYKLNLFYQPPQPREMVTYETILAVLQVPKNLREVPFHVTYEPPPPPPPGQSDTSIRKTPEEIEAEMKQQEMELDKLMLVTLELPQHVMWFDLPIIGHWDPDNKIWTIDDIHDLRHVEEKGYLTFRTGTFGYFGLASYRYGNLPFQAWEMKPESDGSVTIQLTAAVLMFEFNVKENLICVTQLQNGPNDALQEIVGIYMKLSKLKRILLKGGIDIFPMHDSFSYIEGTCEKCWPMERHLYYDIARLTTYFNFAWSRWNLLAGRRNIVFQMREFKLNKPKQRPHSLCLVTPLKALYIDCTEVSQTFNDEGITGMKFYADLMNLVRGTSSMSLKAKILSAPQRTITTVANFLLATRIMSLA